jgi:branched-chain amino acid transport system permease protein
VGGLGSMRHWPLAAGLGVPPAAATPFAMITFGLGELVWATALMFPAFFGGEAGISGNRVTGGRALGVSFGPQIQMYYLIAAYTFVCTALMFAFTLTPLGRVLNAVRDNPLRAAFLGFNPHVVRYLAFVIAAFFAGVSGGLAALNFEIVTTEVLSAHRSGAYLLFTLLGGTGFFFGPMIGAVLMVLAFVVLSAYTQAWLVVSGAGVCGDGDVCARGGGLAVHASRATGQRRCVAPALACLHKTCEHCATGFRRCFRLA